MPTTFSPTFKNYTLDSFTGRSSTTSALSYMNFYNGTQPADPTVTPSGSSVFSSYSLGVNVASYMSQPASGISSLSVQRSASATSTVTSLTFARIYAGNGTTHIDTPVSTTGGGGGVIVSTLASSAGVQYVVEAFSFKMPLSLSTILLNTDLANALVNAWVVSAANIAAGSSASIKVYTGSAPATADAPATGSLLVTFTTAASGTSWNVASGGSTALAANLTATASGTGTAGYVRLEKGAYVLQGSVGTASADFLLDTTSITSGNTITLTEATLTI